MDRESQSVRREMENRVGILQIKNKIKQMFAFCLLAILISSKSKGFYFSLNTMRISFSTPRSDFWKFDTTPVDGA